MAHRRHGVRERHCRGFVGALYRTAKELGIHLTGAGAAEHPDAYRPMAAVLRELDCPLQVVGKFSPRIVRMAPCSEPTED